MIRAIHQREARTRQVKPLAKRQPAKPRAEHNDVNWFAGFHCVFQFAAGFELEPFREGFLKASSFVAAAKWFPLGAAPVCWRVSSSAAIARPPAKIATPAAVPGRSRHTLPVSGTATCRTNHPDVNIPQVHIYSISRHTFLGNRARNGLNGGNQFQHQTLL